ncbi:CG14495 [Drosophila busckii]|uniref:CG14495 n=1 Tax=Drosophila busckii TaxID=30019 RepID=A0A0M4EI49_DROBS|nr:uncharacterized protein LOC108595562 [Drosophila busckii]ALC42385.1 CG14495 [Drosophila busckii]
MRAVQKQLENETRRRHLWLWALLLVQLLLARDSHADLPADEWPESTSTLDECHDEYALASANASSIYMQSFSSCELTANETKYDLSIDEQMEREQIQLGASTVCNNMQQCDTLDEDLEYFKCMQDNGKRNQQLLMQINYNASSAETRLREDYDAVQQTFVLCTLEAQLVYVNGMRENYEQLLQCRS